jgi:hypothetical protein
MTTMQPKWLAVVVAGCALALSEAVYLQIAGGDWPVRLSLIGLTVALSAIALWVVGSGRTWRK